VAPSERSLKVVKFDIEWLPIEKSGIKTKREMGNHKTVKIKFVAIYPTRKLEGS